MHKLLKQLLAKHEGLNEDAQRVIEISDRLIAALMMPREIFQLMKTDDNLAVGDYLIIKERRFIGGKWVTLLEITTSNAPEPGYRNTENPWWIYEPKGTTTINIPPDHVVEEVINLIILAK